MHRTVVMLTLALIVGIAVGMLGNQVLNAQEEPIKRTVLRKTDLAGIEGKEAVVVLVEIASWLQPCEGRGKSGNAFESARSGGHH